MQPAKERIIVPELTLAMVVKPENVAQQSVISMAVEQQDDVEQQLTMLMPVQPGEVAQQAMKARALERQKEVEEQPTQEIAVERDKVAEQPTLAMVLKQHIHSPSIGRWFVPALMCLVLLSGTFVGIAALH